MKLYLLRHGHRGNGEAQDTLTKLGIEQARRTAFYLQDKQIDKIICGTSQRTRNTGIIIQERIHCPIEHTPIVNEQSLGIYEGKTKKEWEAAVASSGLAEHAFRPEHGENRQDAYKRAQQFIQILEKETAQALLVISHAGFISDVITLLLSLPEQEHVHFKTGFCALSTFELSADLKVKNFFIGELKHLAHL